MSCAVSGSQSTELQIGRAEKETFIQISYLQSLSSEERISLTCSVYVFCELCHCVSEALGHC